MMLTRETVAEPEPPPRVAFSPAPPRPTRGETVPEVHVPRVWVPGEAGRASGGPPPPASARRPKRRATAWVGEASTGEELVVLTDPKGAVVGVWSAPVDRLDAVEEAARLGAADGAVVRVVIDVSSAVSRMLSSAIRERLSLPVEDTQPALEVFSELRAMLDQGAMVYHLLELVKLARASGEGARRAAVSLAPALQEMQRPAERVASIPQIPMPAWRRRLQRIARPVGIVLFGLLFLAGGALAARAIRHHAPSVQTR